MPSPRLEPSNPSRTVVIYDGQCRFCQLQMRWLRWWDGRDRLEIISLHDEQVAQRWPDLDPQRLRTEMAVVDRGGTRHFGADAVRVLVRTLPRLWWLVPPLAIPGSMPLWRWLYRLVARHRYRLLGRAAPPGEGHCDDGTCEVHLR